MKPSENLFDLIKSLTKEDKEWIMASAQFHIKGTENKYIVLFWEIDKLDVYDEPLIIKKLEYQSQLNKFAFLKNYLYNFILDGLEERNQNPRKLIRAFLNRAEILIQKDLWALAIEQLDEALALSRKTQLLDLWAQTLQNYMQFPEMESELRSQFQKELLRVLNAKKSFIHYRKLFCLVRAKHHQSAFLRDILQTKEFKDVHEEELLESSPDLNFHHKLFFYLSKGIVYYARKDYEKSTILVNELLKMWHKYDWMIEVRFGAYFNTLYNKALIESNTKHYKQAIQSISELYTKLTTMRRENPFERYMTYNLWIRIYNMCGYYDRALSMVKEYKNMRESLQRSSINPYSEQLYHFYLANVYFGTGDYKSANKHINEIINNSIEYNNDVTCIAQLMSLVIHYELGNADLLGYRIKSVYRFLKRRDCLELTISHVLDFLRKMGRVRINEELLNQRFKELRQQIDQDLKIDPIQKDVIEYFDILSWLDSKILNKPFIEVSKEKYNYILNN